MSNDDDWIFLHFFHLLLHESLFLEQEFVTLFVENCIVLDLFQPDWRRQFGHLLIIVLDSWFQL